jgi:hypothetical protein
MSTLYDQDFYAWANEQAALLRAGKLTEADIANIAEEIESMGRTEKRELVSRLTALLLNLLKWQYQPDRRGNSWKRSIANSRDQLEDHLADNPSLRSKLAEALLPAYRYARRGGANETGFEETVFPAECPWAFEQIMDDDFWPEDDGRS